ncbi:MAG: hypothetical protein V4754_07125 [Pseudomonadota bacterium]
MTAAGKRIALALGLAATLAAAWFAPAEPAVTPTLASAPGAVKPARASAKRARAVDSTALDVLSIRRRDLEPDDDGEHDGRLFALAQWSAAAVAPPAAPAPVAEPVAPAQAPPLPFHLLGRYQQQGRAVVFLQFNDQNLVVQAGDTIAELYKVESIGASSMQLRYIPLGQQQTLDLGGGSEK